MARPRGGDRSKRTNYCIACKGAIPAGHQAQMLRFTYLCQECHDQDLRLELATSDITSRRTVRLTKIISQGDTTMPNQKPQTPVPTGSNCAHIGCP